MSQEAEEIFMREYQEERERFIQYLQNKWTTNSSQTSKLYDFIYTILVTT